MLFRKGNVREPEKLPPTRDALMQHTKRAHFQALVWSNACYTKPDVPPLTLLGYGRRNIEALSYDTKTCSRQLHADCQLQV